METENWIQYFTNKEEYGKEIPYYFNKTTKVTQWEEPEEMEYYFYAKPEQKDCSPSPVTLPENYITMDYRSMFQLIGIDSISSLKHNSIRKLQIYHQSFAWLLIQFRYPSKLRLGSNSLTIEWIASLCSI